MPIADRRSRGPLEGIISAAGWRTATVAAGCACTVRRDNGGQAGDVEPSLQLEKMMWNAIRPVTRVIATLALSTAATGVLAADVSVSIGISQPGVYGRIDIGRYPPPVLVQPRPVWVARPAQVVVQPEPVYLWVPPGHRKHWRKHCGAYGACGAPVYFVQDRWYHDHVAPTSKPGRGRGHGHGHHKH